MEGVNKDKLGGQPKRRAIIQELSKRAREHISDDATSLEYVALEMAGGKTLTKLAAELTDALGVGEFTREVVRRLLVDAHGDERVSEVFRRARLIGAGSFAEQAQQIVDDAVEDRDSIAKAKLRADFRARMAGWWNREEYGAQQAVAVQVNVGDLHIDAMRRVAINNPLPAKARIVQAEEPQDVRLLPQDNDKA